MVLVPSRTYKQFEIWGISRSFQFTKERVSKQRQRMTFKPIALLVTTNFGNILIVQIAHTQKTPILKATDYSHCKIKRIEAQQVDTDCILDRKRTSPKLRLDKFLWSNIIQRTKPKQSKPRNCSVNQSHRLKSARKLCCRNFQLVDFPSHKVPVSRRKKWVRCCREINWKK